MLQLFEDVLPNGATLPLPAAPRMIYVVHGEISVEGATLTDGGTWHGVAAADIVAGETGATIWRFDLSAGPQMASGEGEAATRLKLAAPLIGLPDGELLFRGDSVAFPPGGCALLHTHQGPGIRVLIEGAIRIDTHGRSTSYGPGGAWFENGPEPVFAQAAADRDSRFIRVMVLPRALLGKSSIRYVNEADKDKPKSQRYQVFVDAPIERPE